MSEKIKILILTKSIDGGTGTFSLGMLKLGHVFSKTKIKIKLISLEKPSYRKIKGKKVIFFHKPRYYPEKYSFCFKNIKSFLKEILETKKVIAKDLPKMVLTVGTHANLLGLINKMFFPNLKVLITIHNNLLSTLKEKSSRTTYFVLEKLIAFWYKKADQIITVSDGIKKQLQKNFKLKKVSVIYNGIELPTQKITVKKFPRQKPCVFSMGRFSEQKDFTTLIKAFRLVSQKIPDCQLLIIGDGPKKKQVISLIQKYKLKNKIKILNWQNDVSVFLKRSDLFILSSRREGFPYVLIEALSFGLPVISTQSPFGPREILGNNQYGLLTPVGKPKPMAKAIINLLTNKEKYEYYSRQALKRKQEFTLEKMLKEYKKNIKKLI